MLYYFLYPFLFFTYFFCFDSGAVPPAVEMKDFSADVQNAAYDPGKAEETVGLLDKANNCTDGGTFKKVVDQEHQADGGGYCACALATGFFGTLGAFATWALIQGMTQHG